MFPDSHYCRICEKYVGGLSWYNHVRDHKVIFCLETGVDPLNYRKIPWELCVRRFNPSNSRPDPTPPPILPSQRTLSGSLSASSRHLY
jgi:hypothetical protein